MVGAIIMGVGVAQFTRAHKEKFKRKWSTAQMCPAEIAWATRAARFGLSARSVVFLIMGGFLIVAALPTQPSKATGINGALDTLRPHPLGAWLLGFVVVGLICYGIYCGINTVYRRINP